MGSCLILSLLFNSLFSLLLHIPSLFLSVLQKCTVEVFVEQLWVPALKAGVIENVQDILKALDHSLIQWESYLTAVCRYLSQRSLYHILYQTQLYMRVGEGELRLF